MAESILKCPVCDNELFWEEKTCRCINNHSFDVSKNNYVNLILSNQKHSINSGDSPEMVKARDKFLNKGYYKELSDNVNHCIVDSLSQRKDLKELEEASHTLDMGCGMGYYINELKKKLDSDKIEMNFYGLDVSKESVKCAASRYKNINFIVGNAFRVPFVNNSLDCIINIFAPISEDEVARVLKPKGIAITVRPGKNHLIEMKKMLYKSADYHEEDKVVISNLSLVKRYQISYLIKVEKDDLEALYGMTPYFWNTQGLSFNEDNYSTDITTDFIVSVYQKT